jgi:deoxyribodipyrimidine photo-lyase
MDLSDIQAVLASLRIDRTVKRTAFFQGGTGRAKDLLRTFIRKRLPDYPTLRNDPSLGVESHMSPYLHFGQISPLQIVREIRRAKANRDLRGARDAYLEELLIRRELAMNFAAFNPRCDRYSSLPRWAQTTLKVHKTDKRPYQYSREQLERAGTHDPYWNAAMTEMRITGKMHNYMRMYWGKKILEWTPTPSTAFRRLLAINNKYFLDGRDPVSFANVAWIFGKHDRPWQERSIFGTVRYMAASGLERKFDMDAYVRKIEALSAEHSNTTDGPRRV